MNLQNIFKNSSFFGFIFVFIFSLFTLLYYVYFIKKKNYFYLDNPTNQVLSVKIDNKEFSIQPKTFMKLHLEMGKHIISLVKNNAAKFDTFFEVNDINGVVNPTLSDYYIYKKVYGYVENKDSIVNSYKTLTIDKIKYKGNISHHKKLFIDKFDFGFDESFPKLIHKDSINFRTKVYRKEDFTNEFDDLKQ